MMDFNLLVALEHMKFIRKKPLVIPRILSGFFNRLVLGKPVLRTVDWAMDYACNFNCKMCSAKYLIKKDRPRITPSQMSEIWRQCLALGAIHTNLTGGEPLLLNDICDRVRAVSPERTLVSLVTNAWFATRDKIFELRDAGLDTIQLSIESLDKNKNDYIRKKGSFDRIMRALEYAKEADLNICLSAVLSKENVDDVWKLIDFAKENSVFLLVNPLSSTGNAQSQRDLKLIEEQKEILEQMLKIKHVRSDIILNFSGKRGCPGGVERIEITAYGDVMTCPHVQVSYGNVLEEPLEKILKRMRAFEPISKYSKDCKMAWDLDYNQRIIKPTEKLKELPLSIFDHPNVSKEEKKMLREIK